MTTTLSPALAAAPTTRHGLVPLVVELPVGYRGLLGLPGAPGLTQLGGFMSRSDVITEALTRALRHQTLPGSVRPSADTEPVFIVLPEKLLGRLRDAASTAGVPSAALLADCLASELPRMLSEALTGGIHTGAPTPTEAALR